MDRPIGHYEFSLVLQCTWIGTWVGLPSRMPFTTRAAVLTLFSASFSLLSKRFLFSTRK